MASQPGPSHCLDLPPNIMLEYMNEGAANVLYRVLVTRAIASSPGDETHTDALRDPPGSCQNNPEDVRAFSSASAKISLPPSLAPRPTSPGSNISTLLHTDLVPQILVKLPTNLIEKLNLELQSWENNHTDSMSTTSPDNLQTPPSPSFTSTSTTTHPRLNHRRGIYLASDDHGILVVDMTPRPSPLSQPFTPPPILLEFKPKWLQQSPSAPPSSIRCRTCALTARRNSLRQPPSNADLLPLICPLDLLSSSPSHLQYISTQLLIPHGVPNSVISRFTHFLQITPMLRRLRNLQEGLDPVGVLEGDGTSEMLRLAMTLRDCSVFVQIEIGGWEDKGERDEAEIMDEEGRGIGSRNGIIARLGDLDLKCSGKGEAWRRTERELIDEGWYIGSESVERKQPVVCALSEGRWEAREALRSAHQEARAVERGEE